MKKTFIDDKMIKASVHDLIRMMNKDSWRPDYIVGITRGGLVPATMLSYYLEVPLETLKVSLRDSDLECESNLWMPEHAFGYVDESQRDVYGSRWDPSLRKKILVVDDINDSGATLNWIKQDWQSSCLPKEEAWKTVWHHNVRFAVLVNNSASDFKNVDYCAHEINSNEQSHSVEFSWERWWL